MSDNRILVLNPGSTSTKIALFTGDETGVGEIFTRTIEHQQEELEKYDKVTDQQELRLSYITSFIEEADLELSSLSAVVGRGGLLKPITGGTYTVNAKMRRDLEKGLQGEHASNLGGLLAHALAEKADAEAYIVDPVVVDEMRTVAKISGKPELERRSIFHALNQKAVARKFADQLDCGYENLTVIVTHLGGGISVGLHHEGKVIDVNNALCGEGPFSPNRAGTLPTLDLAMYCYEDEMTESSMKKQLLKQGGVVGYLGTNDMKEVEERAAEGDEKAQLVFKAMAYQVAKEIGSLAPAAPAEIDGILLTGGIAYSDKFVQMVTDRVEFIAPVKVFPGEEEMSALAAGANRVLTGQEKAKIYE